MCVVETEGLQFEVPHLACSVYYGALKDLPAMVRLWWNSQEKRVFSTVDKFTSKYVSGVLSAQEIASVQSSTQTFENMMVSQGGEFSSGKGRALCLSVFCDLMCFVITGESAFYHAGGDRYLLCRRYLHRAGDSATSELSPWVYLSGEWAESGCGRSAVAQLDASAQHVPHTPGTGSIQRKLKTF